MGATTRHGLLYIRHRLTRSSAASGLVSAVAGSWFRFAWWAVLAVGVLAAGMEASSGSPQKEPPAAAPVPRPADPTDRLPPGAVARLGWSPHCIGNAAFALTPDEKEIVTVAPEGIVSRFDATTGKLLERRQFTPRAGVWPFGQTSARLSTDGRTAAIDEPLRGGNRRVTVSDVPAGKVLFRRDPEKDVRVGQFVLSPDGKVLAVREDVGQKTLLRAYDVATGKGRDIGRLEFNTYELQFSADGKRLVASQSDTAPGGGPFLACFDVPAGKQLWKLPSDRSQFALSPDGNTVAYHHYTKRGFQLIEADLQTGKPAERLVETILARQGVNALAFAPDSRTLLIDCIGNLVSLDVRTGQEVGRIAKPSAAGSGYGPKVGAFSRDGKTVVTNFGVLGRWDLTTGKPLFDPQADDGLGGPVEHVAFTPDGKEVFASGWSQNSARWDVATGRQVVFRRQRYGHQFVTTPDGLRSVWVDHYQSAHETAVYDPIAGTPVHKLRWSADGELDINSLRAYALAADGRTLLAAHYDWSRQQLTHVTLTDVPSSRRLARFSVSGSYTFAESPFSPCGRWMVLAGKVYHTRTGTELFAPAGDPGERLLPAEPRMANSPVWFSPDGRLLAGLLERVGAAEKIPDTLAVWELASGQVLARFPGARLLGEVVFSPDGRTVALVDTRGARLHDLLTDRQTAEFVAPDINIGVVDRGCRAQTTAFSPDGRTLATGHRDGSITLWAVPEPAAVGSGLAWAGLGDESPVRGRAAVDRAARDPAAAVQLLAAEFRPPKAKEEPPDPAVAALIADLDNDEFATREGATKKLRELGAKAEPALRRALAAGPSPEVRRRIEGLLTEIPPTVLRLPVSGATLRGVRAIEVLERVGTPEARELLTAWANQAHDPLLASEARTALMRFRAGGGDVPQR